ncbi:MAG: TldD/PmbA family protein [Phycisphaerales bacterium]|nr:MAG: TldD/PmbA family protein [Phycisphaerales bacterium]
MKKHIELAQRVGRSAILIAVLVASVPSVCLGAEEHPLLAVMQSELSLSKEKLTGPEGIKPYFLQYAIANMKSLDLTCTLGSIVRNEENHRRLLDVDVRCGDYALDNTHQIRGGYYGGYGYDGGGFMSLPLNDDPLATRHAIWLRTDRVFKAAVKRLAAVEANMKVKVEEEDPSDDFSREDPSVHIGAWIEVQYDRGSLAERIKKYSRRFRQFPLIYDSSVALSANVSNKLMVSSEGGKLQFGQQHWRIGIRASTIAEDGMELWQYESFDAHTLEGLPDDDEVIQAVDRVIRDVLALREAPIVEPYTGPAILMSRASGVFFHEIFGHRIEGHRQKDVEEGQTFAKKLGEQILPPFLSIIDDPSRRQFKGTDLNGYYPFDDECISGQPTHVVEEGVLKTFLMSRSPARGITKSNGHGRRQPGMNAVARQGNLIIESTKTVSFDQLRALLVDECKKQGKEYGLLFKDISGGFTITERWLPQSFKVLPLVVYKVYADGRPDQLVRGVDIVGTPLTCFSKILYTANDDGVFNGYCGAESGSIPVSAVSPSILVEQIEVEKKRKAQDRPPILEAPIASEEK